MRSLSHGFVNTPFPLPSPFYYRDSTAPLASSAHTYLHQANARERTTCPHRRPLACRLAHIIPHEVV